jgi:demethylphylloquinone reductase
MWHSKIRKNTNIKAQDDGKANPSRVCILGGGFAGLYTALYLDHLYRFHRKKPKIILIDRCDRFLFTPLLYERITGELQPWEIAPSFKKLLENTEIQFYQETVRGVDLGIRQIRLQSSNVLSYDYLVLAVGRETSAQIVNETTDHVYPFRTLDDAERLNERLQELENSDGTKIRIAIAGGGPSGVELAGKIADRLQDRGKICLLNRGDQLLKNFSKYSQNTAYQSLVSRGVLVKLNTVIEALDTHQITVVHPDQIKNIPVDLVIGTIGTQPRKWLLELDCQHDSLGKLFTKPTLQLANYPEVFALGDLAHIRNGKEQIPATAQAAFQQASCTARNLQAAISGKPLRSFHYLHLGEMLALGVNNGIVSSFGINLTGGIAAFIRQWVYILLRMPTIRHRFQIVCYHWKRLIRSGWSGVRRRSVKVHGQQKVDRPIDLKKVG